jgi:hypothetical protein
MPSLPDAPNALTLRRHRQVILQSLAPSIPQTEEVPSS